MHDVTFVQRVGRRVGYGIAAFLVMSAVAVLFWPLLDTGEPAAVRPVVTGAPGVSVFGPQPNAQAEQQQQNGNPFAQIPQGPTQAPATGLAKCGITQATYGQSGTDLDVTVVFPGKGTVNAKLTPKKGLDLVQSYTTDGDPQPHIFKFLDVAENEVKSIELSIFGETEILTCPLPKK